MTEARVVVPAERDGGTVETDPGHMDTPTPDRPAGVPGNPSQAGRAGSDPVGEVQADPAPEDPVWAVSGTGLRADPACDGQDDPDQVVPDAVPVSSANADLAADDNLARVESATAQAGPADGEVAAEEENLVTADPATGQAGPADADLTEDHSPVPVESATGQAGPARSDPAGDGQDNPDQMHSVPVAADPPPDEPSASHPATPPLRDPDEAALRLAEAAVFASATPVTARALSQILPDDLDPAAVIAALQARYAGRGLELCEVGGGLQFRTAADLAPQLRKVVQVPRRLPRVALETLAIVAYHQPITRPEIEDLRGTGLSQQTLDVLLENDLIVARGRKETPGRPTLWGTTAKFLEYFGLRDIRELPRRQDLLLEAVRPEGASEAELIPPENAQPGGAGTLPV